MSNIEIKNATIRSTMLGKEDHGIMTCFLYLDYGNSQQGFGGYDLGGYGIEFITRTIETLGGRTTSWEDLPGKHVRVKMDGMKIVAIGHIIEDRWFSPEVDLKHHFE